MGWEQTHCIATLRVRVPKPGGRDGLSVGHTHTEMTRAERSGCHTPPHLSDPAPRQVPWHSFTFCRLSSAQGPPPQVAAPRVPALPRESFSPENRWGALVRPGAEEAGHRQEPCFCAYGRQQWDSPASRPPSLSPTSPYSQSHSHPGARRPTSPPLLAQCHLSEHTDTRQLPLSGMPLNTPKQEVAGRMTPTVPPSVRKMGPEDWCKHPGRRLS